MSTRRPMDPEAKALDRCIAALEDLIPDAQARVAAMAFMRYGPPMSIDLRPISYEVDTIPRTAAEILDREIDRDHHFPEEQPDAE